MGAHVYYPDEVKALCAAFFAAVRMGVLHAKLYQLLDPAVERFKKLDETRRTTSAAGW
jgi:hypothetical protein